jgi:hypothetical protein
MTPVRWLIERVGRANVGLRGDEPREPGAGGLELSLRDNEATSFAARPGCEISCDAGVALVTLEGDPRDHVLERGDTLRISRRGRVAALALGECLLRVDGVAPPAERARRAGCA